MSIPEEIRATLARRCRSRRTRTSVFTRDAPTEWQPLSLRDPRNSNSYFTDDSAWEFVAEALEAAIEVEAIELNRPAGKTGYVMKVPGANDLVIYVKLQLGAANVIGRSFHENKTGLSDG